LLAVARYKALAELRRRPQAASPNEDGPEISDPADTPEVAFEIKHRGEILRKCLGRLSREHREVIDLVYYHEKSVQEVAEIIGIRGNTVKTRMFYARKQLSKLLEAEGVVGALS
jgi:RNA polymerase sigma-70 factor (ECF subfamily)